jgi:hypothetical protein
MPVMRASSDWRWLRALVTFCACSVSSQRSGAPASSLRRAISARSRETSTTSLMSPKVCLSAWMSAERSSSSMIIEPILSAPRE